VTYDVGRPLVREALHNLTARGLLEVSPGRGTFVRSVTGFGRVDFVDLSRNATARQVVEARVTLEGQAARLAAERAHESQIALMQAALERLALSKNPVERGQLDVAFHLTIARASGNPVIEAMLGSIAPLMVQLMMRSIFDGRTASRSHPLHLECFEAIRARDPDAAERAMVAHLRVADETYGEGYDEPLDLETAVFAKSLISDYGSLDALVTAVLRPDADISSA
jgi:GntR family transcriptional regulator, transcriptional repressor for pyruvate dehydrogenase complex